MPPTAVRGTRRAGDREPPPASAPRSGTSREASSRWIAAAVLLSAVFVGIAWRLLATLPWEYDEGTFMLGARSIARGLRPFVDFSVHQPPLHLQLLALAGDLFGETVAGYRMLSVLSVAASGLLLFVLVRAFAGPLPALAAQAVFLFSPSELHSLSAVGEPPMLAFLLLGYVLLFLGTGPWSACAAAAACVVGLLVKPTGLLLVGVPALCLVVARAWRRLAWFAGAGIAAGLLALVWLQVSSDGIFGDILRFTTQRVGARSGGLWTIDSGFPELLALLGVATPGQWTWFCFRNFWYVPEHWLPLALFLVSFLGLPMWIARARRDVAAFAVLWPLACIVTNFVALDYVSAKYFAPFLAFSAFLLAGVVWWAEERLPARAAVAGGVGVCLALAVYFAWALGRQPDPWYYARAEWLASQHPHMLSFTPMLHAATGTEPACDFDNPADTYGDFGEQIMTAEPVRHFRVSDDRLIACLRANPDLRVVVDFWYYFFTRPGSALRAYLQGEGANRVVFFSQPAADQWNRPTLMTGAVAR